MKMSFSRVSILLPALICLAFAAGGCSEKPPAVIDTKILPGVQSLKIVSESPLKIRAKDHEGGAGLYVILKGESAKAAIEKVIQSAVELKKEQTLVAYDKRIAYHYTLVGKKDKKLEFATVIRPPYDQPTNATYMVRPYGGYLD